MCTLRPQPIIALLHFKGSQTKKVGNHCIRRLRTPCPVVQCVGTSKLTCTLGPAHKRRSRWAGSTLSRSSQQHTDVVLCVWIQVPQLICDHVDSMHLWPWRLAGTILNLLPDNGAISQDGVGVELDDQVSGASAQQLGWCNGGRRYCERKWKAVFFALLFKHKFILVKAFARGPIALLHSLGRWRCGIHFINQLYVNRFLIMLNPTGS